MMYDGTLMDGICTLFGMLVDAHVGILVDAHVGILVDAHVGILVDAHVGILVDAHVGIWWIHFIDDIFWHIVDVHG
jgi:hypothetical protein